MTDPRTVPLTDAQLENLEKAARASFGEDECSQGLINGVLSLITEVRKLRTTVAAIRTKADQQLLDGSGCPFCKRGSGHYAHGEYWHDDDCIYEKLGE